MGKTQNVGNFLMDRDEDEPMEGVALTDLTENGTDVIVDDYKDLPIEMVASSREKKLWWMGVDD